MSTKWSVIFIGESKLSYKQGEKIGRTHTFEWVGV